jgi:hypothetical protein
MSITSELNLSGKFCVIGQGENTRLIQMEPTHATHSFLPADAR